MNTVLPTGPGSWELRDKGISVKSRKEKTKSVLTAIPSLSHMAIVQLYHNGSLKMLVSQNTDGLHLRSGLDPNRLCELHGNTNLEVCIKCGARYLRDFRTRNARKVHDHFTGRFCDDSKCKGRLKDSIINFGEDLPEEDLSKAYLHAEKADLCIAIGSSLRVTPANEIPRIVARNQGKLVICNLQKTPLDSKASLLIHAFCDDVMYGLMQRLDMPIPKWELVRKAKIEVSVKKFKSGNKQLSVSVLGLHPIKSIPYSIFKKIVFDIDAYGYKVLNELDKEPFHISKMIDGSLQRSSSIKIKCKLVFQGHYGEPPLDINEWIDKDVLSWNKECVFSYDPSERRWCIS